jgi:hypothetical protein
MIVTEQTTGLPARATREDFAFMHPVIAELDNIPTKEKVTFPTESRSAVFADIEANLLYKGYQPVGEFFFRSREHGLEMSHSAIVSYAVVDGALLYQLTMQPNANMRSKGRKATKSIHSSAKAVALAICRSYALGSVNRKVLLLKAA